MQDKELFDLCKRVYGLTGWDDTPFTYKRLMTSHTLKWKEWFIADYNNGKWNDVGEQSIPLYNSDYLLELLPDALHSPSLNIAYRLCMKKIGKGYFYEYSNHPWFRDMKSVFSRKGYDTNDDRLAYAIKPVTADTPLKALLKLTIALHEAGELK